MMYPNPTVVPDITLVAWTPRGSQITNLLRYDQRLVALERTFGYRTPYDNVARVRDLSKVGIHVADLASLPTAELPTNKALQSLIDAVMGGPG